MDGTNPEQTTEKKKIHFPTWKFHRPCEYKPEYCDIVVELGKLGKSLYQMAVACNVSKVETLRRWQTQFPEFDEAMQFAQMCSQDWWENIGQEYIIDQDGKKLNASWIKQMELRFRHAWRPEAKLEIEANVTTVPKLSFAERPDNELDE